MIERVSPSLSTPAAPATLGVDATRPVAGAAAQAAGVDFSSMLGDLAVKAAGEVRNAETQSIAGVRGQASVQQVVEAVMSAEQSLQTAIAVRDKVVSAYLEISRMSI
jgi:flagellar hook-basal body complex protein FliE